MNKPWDIKTGTERGADNIPVFILFCEDGAVEPEYFNAFRSDKIRISTIPTHNKQHHAIIDFASEEYRKKGLITIENGKEVLMIGEGAQVWCIFDRDKNPGDEKATAFNDSISAAYARGIRVAWSNDAFELWVLLHFEEVMPADPVFSDRSAYYRRLTHILKSSLPLDTDEAGLIEKPRFDYASSMKSKKNFTRFMLQRMKGRTETAIARAAALSAGYDPESSAPETRCPCTMVHLLVQELILAGGIAV